MTDTAKIVGWRPSSSEKYILLRPSELKGKVVDSTQTVTLEYVTTLAYLENTLAALRNVQVNVSMPAISDIGASTSTTLHGVWTPQTYRCSFGPMDFVRVSVTYEVIASPAIANMPSDLSIYYPQTNVAQLKYKSTVLQTWVSPETAQFRGLEIVGIGELTTASIAIKLNGHVMQTFEADRKAVGTPMQYGGYRELITVMSEAPTPEQLDTIAAENGTTAEHLRIVEVVAHRMYNSTSALIAAIRNETEYAGRDMRPLGDLSRDVSVPPRISANASTEAVERKTQTIYEVYIWRPNIEYVLDYSTVAFSVEVAGGTATVSLKWNTVVLQTWSCPA